MTTVLFRKGMVFAVILLFVMAGTLFIDGIGADEVVSHELIINADDYYSKQNDWSHYGNHIMHCDYYWIPIGYQNIYYYLFLNASYIIDNSLVICTYYKADHNWLSPLTHGPELLTYNWNNSDWDSRTNNMGGCDWRWKNYTIPNPNNYLSSSGSLYFQFRCLAGEHVWVRNFGIKWQTNDGLIPDKPMNFEANNSTSSSIQLSWIKGNNSDKTCILRKSGNYPSNPTDGSRIYYNNGTSFTDTNLTPGEKYHYTAWAVNTQIEVNDIFSQGFCNAFEYTKPGKPNNFNRLNITATTINLSWLKGIGSNKTMVRRQLIDYPESPLDGVNVYFGNDTSISDTGLSIGTKYFYSIWSYDDESGYFSLDNSEANFITINYPQVKTNNATNMGGSGVNIYCRLNGEIINDGGKNCEVRFKIKIANNGSWWFPSNWSDVKGTGDYFDEIVDYLDGSAEYLFAAGAKNCAGEHWGDICNFTTKPGPPVIDEIKSYYADGSSASSNNDFLLQGINLTNIYTAFTVGDDADNVKFYYDFPGSENYDEHTDNDGSDGWTYPINFTNLHPDSPLNVRAYNNTYGWGKNKTYKPKIIPMETWLNLYLSYTSYFSYTNFTTFSIGEIDDPPHEYDNYYLLFATTNFSTGCPENDQESPVDVGVPDGVPDDFGGDYGFSGGIGSSILLCSDGTINVYGGAEASVKVRNLLSGGIAAKIYGDLNVTDKINWNSMAININGYVQFPIFRVPLILCGIPASVGVDIKPHVNVTFNLETTNNSDEGIIPGLGIKIKENDGMNGSVGCSIIAYMESNILIAELYVEVGGDGTLYFKTPPDEHNGFFYDFTLETWILGRARFLYWEAEGRIDNSWRWSDQNKPMFYGKNDSSNETQWRSLNRSYINPEQGEYAHFAWDEGSNNGAIVENAFPYAEPCMAANMDQKSDAGVMIVWSHDDKTQPPVKGMEIRYTRTFSDGFVEVPETIDETHNDGRLQMDPQIIYDKNDDIICVFVQTDSSISDESSMNDVFNSTEIAYCIWDGNLGTWGSIENLTDNNYMDVQPKLSSNADGDVVLVWTSDYDGDYKTMNDGNIYASFWNGSQWSDILTIAKDFPVASAANVALNDENMAICVFSGDDIDKNISTPDDQNIFYTMFYHNSTYEQPIKFTFDYDNQDTEPSALFGLDGKPYIVWLKNMVTYVNDWSFAF